MACFTRKFIRDDKSEVEVDGAYRIIDDGVELSDCSAWLWSNRHDPRAPFVTLTDSEIERLVEEIVNDDSTWETEPDYD